MNRNGGRARVSADRARLCCVALAWIPFVLGCSGPIPLSIAIDPQDESEYTGYLNAFKQDGRKAYLRWMTQERGVSKLELVALDETLSTTTNPFDAYTDPQAVSRGAVMYKMHCARCHGDDATGNGPSMLADHPTADFHSFEKRFASTLHRGAPRSWFRKISEGHGDEVKYDDERTRAMPAFGDQLTREQIWLAITYLQSLDQYARQGRG